VSVKSNRVRLAMIAGGLALAGCAATPPPGSGPFSGPQIAAMQKAGFVKADRGWEFSMADRLLFATDRSEVLPGQATVITHMAQALQDVGIRHVDVEGHTDGTGGVRYNDALSVRRAGAVAEVMIASGLRREDIKVVGLGERYPVDTNATAAGRRENRRVVVLITAP
jgi:OOP family OmpA-OmpF porin